MAPKRADCDPKMTTRLKMRGMNCQTESNLVKLSNCISTHVCFQAAMISHFWTRHLFLSCPWSRPYAKNELKKHCEGPTFKKKTNVAEQGFPDVCFKHRPSNSFGGTPSCPSWHPCCASSSSCSLSVSSPARHHRSHHHGGASKLAASSKSETSSMPHHQGLEARGSDLEFLVPAGSAMAPGLLMGSLVA